jgi:cysteine synthase
VPLSIERRQRYQALSEVIGHTPFVEITALSLPRRCRLFAKEEYRNPTGSHYDREMLRLLRSLEEDGNIEPGRTRMLETTTGNSGASFAWLCRALGYPPPIIIIPADMPYARKAQIESFGASLLLSAAGEYITGISRSFGQFYTLHADSTDPDVPWCPHHWEDEAHGVQAMRECAEEILRDTQDQQVSLDFMVLALGNGSSARGIGEVLRPRKVTLLGLEPKESPIVAEYLKLPGYEQRRENHRKHGIIGTGPFRESQIYPNMRMAAKMLDDILHVSTRECQAMQRRLMDQGGLHVGMSSAGCVVAVERYIEEKQVTNKVFATIFYDPAWKYL